MPRQKKDKLPAIRQLHPLTRFTKVPSNPNCCIFPNLYTCASNVTKQMQLWLRIGAVHNTKSLSVSCYFTLIHLMHIKGIKALRFWNKKSLDDIQQPAFVKMSRTIPFRTITKRQFPTIVLLFITSSSSFSTSLLTSCTDVTGEQLWNNKNVDGHLRSWLRSRVSVRKGEWIAN